MKEYTELNRSSFKSKNTYLRVSFVFVGLLLPDFILSPKEVWFIYFTFLIITIYYNKYRFQKTTLILSFLLIVPIIWSFLLSLGTFNRDTVRSLFYLSIPPILFLLGSNFNFSKVTLKKYIIFYGTTSVILYIFVLLFFFKSGSLLLDPTLARATFFFPKPILCILSLIFLIEFRYSSFQIIIFLINVYGVFISGSRSYLLLFLIFIALKYIRFTFKNILLTFIVLLIGSIILINLNNRFLSTFDELSYSEEDGNIGVSYRGFETLRAFEKITNGSSIEMALGFGLNDNVDLGMEIDLAGGLFTEIPILHNGYMYIILRLGLSGLLFYFLFFIFYFKREIPSIANERILVYWVILALLLTNFVVDGFFNVETCGLWFILGCFATHNKKKSIILKGNEDDAT